MASKELATGLEGMIFSRPQIAVQLACRSKILAETRAFRPGHSTFALFLWDKVSTLSQIQDETRRTRFFTY